ncbi:MAG: ribosome maturation factor RimM [Mariprofundaceae bacterium]|nr:ribosome maturation factor RimM [Mariprofundaceae bacterium]
MAKKQLKKQPRKRKTPKRLLEVGSIQKPHGLKGSLTVYSFTRPAIGIAGYSFWRIGKTADSTVSYQVVRCWQHGKRILVDLHGIDDYQQAEALKQMRIWVDADAAEADADEYLWADLIGCEVHQRTGDGSAQILGTVIALEDYGAQDILTVRTPDDGEKTGEWLLPFIEDVVLDVDLAARRITVILPEGMDACFTPNC